MASGLFALLDDIATITKLAAASIDDIGAAAAKAGTKAAGVVIDDTAVTPRYLTSFTPDRELPVIWRIAKGSLKNKILFILPIALLLSAFLPWAITPLLMIGGSYLCYEGAEKLLQVLRPQEESLDELAQELAAEDHEAQMANGAIRTDFILSAEIMAIALAEVSGNNIWMQAASLAIVAIAITIGVYGAVALIVKMDDIGLHMAKRESKFSQKVGCTLVRLMPALLGALAAIGTAAMLWVGGQIVLHGMDVLGFAALPQALHHGAEAAGNAAPFMGKVAEWTVGAVGAGIFGVILGSILLTLHHLFTRKATDAAPKSNLYN